MVIRHVAKWRRGRTRNVPDQIETAPNAGTSGSPCEVDGYFLTAKSRSSFATRTQSPTDILSDGCSSVGMNPCILEKFDGRSATANCITHTGGTDFLYLRNTCDLAYRIHVDSSEMSPMRRVSNQLSVLWEVKNGFIIRMDGFLPRMCAINLMMRRRIWRLAKRPLWRNPKCLQAYVSRLR